MKSKDASLVRRGGFAALSPIAKLAVWIVMVVLLAAVVQLAAWLVGLDFNITSQSKSGRAVLLGLALGCLLVIMAADRQSAADYGLVIGPRWIRQWLCGLAAGVVTYSGYCWFAVSLWALESGKGQFSHAWGTAILAVATAVPVAVSQQVIFSGYLLSLFEKRYGRLVATVGISVLFAVASTVGRAGGFWSLDNLPLATGMFLIAALLAMLRLLSGTILVPAGLLAGWIFVRRAVSKLNLLEAGDADAGRWLAPALDPRQAPVLWGFLAALIVLVWLGLRRQNAVTVFESPTIATSFKRIAPFSNMCMMAPLDVWLGRLWRARVCVGIKYVPRLLAVLMVSAINSLLTLPERLLMPLALARRTVRDPIFIVGVHRSGTTHLQNLMALDPALVTPASYQVMNPWGFLISGWLWMPFLAAFTPWRRPMDSVRFNTFAPNEDEFALAAMSHMSPYWGQSFPRQCAHYDRYIHPTGFSHRELSRWKRLHLTFMKTLTFWSGRRPLVKNPNHTARVALLRELYPGAKFIHIVRNPYAVYRSNMHLAQEGHCTYQLHDPDPQTGYAARFLQNYLDMEQAWQRDSQDLPPDDVADVRFEDLERNPAMEIRRIYRQLGFAWEPRFEARLHHYLADVEGYQKNRFQPLPRDTMSHVYANLKVLFERWGYDSEGRPSCNERPRAA